MNFVLIANAWSAGEKNPTSKHRIALELARRGARVLWVEGSGMRTPSLGSGSDRGRMLRKVLAAAKGARLVHGSARGRREWPQKAQKGEGENTQHSTPNTQHPTEERPQIGDPRPETRDCRPLTADRKWETTESGPLTSDFGLSASGNIWVLSPLLVPLPKFELVRRFNGWLCAALARRWSRKLGFEDPVLINYVPVLAEAMRGFRMQGSGVRVAEGGGRRAKKNGRMSNIQHPTPNAQPAVSNLGPSTSGVRVVYHCVDRWDAFSVYDSAMMAEMDARCCRYADVVIASSKDLFERCMEKNPNTYLVTHGVDYEHFAKAAREERPQTGDCRPEASLSRSDGGQVEWQTGDSLPDSTPDTRPSFATATEGKLPTPNIRPSDLPAGRIVGFFGLLSEWVDQDLLVALAKRLAAYGEDGWPQEAQAGEAGAGNHPHVSIVLIGQADVDVSRLRAEPNIALLGPKPFADLPNYIRHFDVGVIPFVVNELTVAVNPIKLREMLAAGCPVVSTALPEVVAYTRDRAVEVASSREAFIAAVGQLVENPPVPSERAALSASMAGETWTAKVDQILAAIDTWPGC